MVCERPNFKNHQIRSNSMYTYKQAAKAGLNPRNRLYSSPVRKAESSPVLEQGIAQTSRTPVGSDGIVWFVIRKPACSNAKIWNARRRLASCCKSHELAPNEPGPSRLPTDVALDPDGNRPESARPVSGRSSGFRQARRQSWTISSHNHRAA